MTGHLIWLTRAEPAVAEQRRLLDAANVPYLCQPLLRLVSIDGAEKARFAEQIQALTAVDSHIFISVNAVNFLLPLLSDAQLQQLRTQTVYAVGKATQRALAAVGISALAPTLNTSSEALLALPTLQHVAGQRFYIYRGVGGRGFLQQQLVIRGATVEHVEIYRRLLPSALDDVFMQAYQRNDIAVTVVGSAEMFDNLLQLLPDWPHHAACVVPSDRVAEYIRAKGYTQVHVAATAHNNDMLALAQSLRDAVIDQNLAENNVVTDQPQTDSTPASAVSAEPKATPLPVADEQVPTLQQPEVAASAAASQPMQEPVASETDATAARKPSRDSHAKPSPKTTVDKPVKTGGRVTAVVAWLSLLLWLTLLGAGGYGVYWYYPQYEHWRSQQAQLQVLPAQSNAQQAMIDGLTAQLATQQEAAQQQAQNLRDMAAVLNEHRADLNALQTADRDDWLLAEVEYLCRLASQRLFSDRNATVAMALLIEADTVLKDMQRASLYPVRAQLADDIQALRAINARDTVGDLIMLQSLSRAIEHITFVPEKQLSSLPPTTPAVADGELTAWERIRERIETLYRIQPIVEPPEPVPSLDQVAVLKQQVKLRLVQAEFSLMQGNQRLFDSSLTFILNMVDEYAQKSPNKQVFLDQIGVLSNVRLTPVMPDITGSHSAIYDYIQARRTHPEAVTP